MECYDRLRLLSSEKGLSFNQIERDLGFGKNSLYNSKRFTPKAETIMLLANYFEVSYEYMFGTSDQRFLANGGDLAHWIADSETFEGERITASDRQEILSRLEVYFHGKNGVHSWD